MLINITLFISNDITVLVCKYQPFNSCIFRKNSPMGFFQKFSVPPVEDNRNSREVLKSKSGLSKNEVEFQGVQGKMVWNSREHDSFGYPQQGGNTENFWKGPKSSILKRPNIAKAGNIPRNLFLKIPCSFDLQFEKFCIKIKDCERSCMIYIFPTSFPVPSYRLLTWTTHWRRTISNS